MSHTSNQVMKWIPAIILGAVIGVAIGLESNEDNRGQLPPKDPTAIPGYSMTFAFPDGTTRTVEKPVGESYTAPLPPREFTLNDDCGISAVVVEVKPHSSVWAAAEFAYGHRGNDFLVKVVDSLQSDLDANHSHDPSDVDVVQPGFAFGINYDGTAYQMPRLQASR